MSVSRPRFVRPADQETLYSSRVPGGEEVLTDPCPDPDGRSSFVYNRHHHLPLEAQRQRLPVFQHRSHILYLLERYQTLVLVGETGSGKSTQVPQYACEVGHRVCVTQPRVAAAVALASRVADERGEHVGERVGYAVGMDSKRGESTDIVFMTEGVLLREMFASPLLTHYSCVVIDEVHERSQLTDVLMGLLKKIARKRKDLKLIVSSATMDAEFLRDFFNVNTSGESSAVAMSVQGRAHPIDVFYAHDPVPNYVKATVDTVIKIHENKPFGDILAFLTSQEEILSALDALETYARGNSERNAHRRHYPSGVAACDMSVLPMYGSLPHYRQVKVFQMADKNVRKVILATNIAETSITVPGISYVIDCGFHKLPYLDAALGAPTVVTCAISRANATQRAGRAGRTARGECYRFSFPTPPLPQALLGALQLLLALGAVDRAGQLTAPLGRRMAELPLAPPAARMLCTAGEYGCLEEALSIVAMLQVDSVFAKSKSGQENIKAKVCRRNNFEVAEGDLLTLLNVYEACEAAAAAGGDRRRDAARRAFCRDMHLDHRAVEKVVEIRKSLEKLVKDRFQLEDMKFDGLEFGSAKTERVQRCILSGLFPQACRLDAGGAYRSVAGGAELHIAADSCLHAAQPPQCVTLYRVVYHSVQSSGDKSCMRGVTAIKKEWLLEVAPHYYRQT